MSEPKPFASLTSGLLARKGAARPAMRPVIDQAGNSFDDLGWNDMGSDPEAGLPQHVPSSISALTPAPRQSGPREAEPPMPPVEPPVIEQMRAIEAHFGDLDDDAEEDFAPRADIDAELDEPGEVISFASSSRSVPDPIGARDKAAFTLRLDEQRHLRLRLATAVQNRSAQRIVTEALDAYLNALPEVDTLAQQVPVRGRKRG